jgi:hypothetical protein
MPLSGPQKDRKQMQPHGGKEGPETQPNVAGPTRDSARRPAATLTKQKPIFLFFDPVPICITIGVKSSGNGRNVPNFVRKLRNGFGDAVTEAS